MERLYFFWEHRRRMAKEEKFHQKCILFRLTMHMALGRACGSLTPCPVSIFLSHYSLAFFSGWRYSSYIWKVCSFPSLLYLGLDMNLANQWNSQCNANTALPNFSMLFFPSFFRKPRRNSWTLEAVRKGLRKSQGCWTWNLGAAKPVIATATLRLCLSWQQPTLTCTNHSKYILLLIADRPISFQKEMLPQMKETAMENHF